MLGKILQVFLNQKIAFRTFWKASYFHAEVPLKGVGSKFRFLSVV